MAPPSASQIAMQTAAAAEPRSRPREPVATASGGSSSGSGSGSGSEVRPYAWQLAWRRIVPFAYAHLVTFRGLVMCIRNELQPYTYLWTAFLLVVAMLGVTGGAHRLWSHRAFKATWRLRALLMLFQTLSAQLPIYNWARDHRLHHKYTDSDADPHDSRRGFFFSHIGCLLVDKHPAVLRKAAGLDLGDLTSDPVVEFQRRYYLGLLLAVAVVVPTAVPVLLWGETVWAAWNVACIGRYLVTLHCTWCINSFAHAEGMRPFDRTISARSNGAVSALTLGEGWHNYHHVFPWDYRAAELAGLYGNLTAAFIEGCARLGWAYDLKTVPQEVVDRRVLRTGDGSHPRERSLLLADGRGDGQVDDDADVNVWGWGDEDMPREDVLAVYKTAE